MNKNLKFLKKYKQIIESLEERSIPNILKEISNILKEDILKSADVIGFNKSYEIEYFIFKIDIKNSNNNQYYSNIDLLSIIKNPNSIVDIVVNTPINYDIDYIVATIIHEVRHIYDIYTINSENDMQSFVNDFYIRKLKIGNYVNFINLVYLSLQHKLIARNNMIYPYVGLKNISKDESINLVKNSFVYKSLDLLNNFDHDNFIKSINIDELLRLTNLFIKDIAKDDKVCGDINDLYNFYKKWENYFKSVEIEWKKEIEKEISKIYELKTSSNNESIIGGVHNLFYEIYKKL